WRASAVAAIPTPARNRCGRGACRSCRRCRRCRFFSSILLDPRHGANFFDLAADERDHRILLVDVVGEIAPLFDGETVIAEPRAAVVRRLAHHTFDFGKGLADAYASDVRLIRMRHAPRAQWNEHHAGGEEEQRCENESAAPPDRSQLDQYQPFPEGLTMA